MTRLAALTLWLVGAAGAACEDFCLPGSGEEIDREVLLLAEDVRGGTETDCREDDECAVVSFGVHTFAVTVDACAEVAARVNEIVDDNGGWECIADQTFAGPTALGPHLAACDAEKCILYNLTVNPGAVGVDQSCSLRS
ncbi:MAG: hypothetical protein A2138_14400 [Deltaproteobacteria bacterium RBG_16_71_12]|nr:MAG: hypothetical protein A2138_14400 [Deltaproteobacteria bacterium RBG_16_71_12]